jgi:hypothetical protein
MPTPKKSKKPAKKPAKNALAARADRYELYGLSVQSSDHEISFFEKIYRHHFGRSPRVLREDFCGTHAVAAAWVKSDPKRVAVGVDLDPEPVWWGREHNELTDEQADRLTLTQGNVLSTPTQKAEILAAENFSYCIFKTREALRTYFKAARKNLAKDGLFVMDLMGGGDCHFEDQEDTRAIRYPAAGKLNAGRKDKLKRFTYVWRQEEFNPITHDALFHIHFRFPDGSEMKNAFTYDWRLWTVPEIRELLLEAGFKQVDVWWDTEVADEDNNPVYAPATDGIPHAAWLCYVVAR